jgi:murein DD-endopeptidase MepM/ murein hydrolase activator NlpD
LKLLRSRKGNAAFYNAIRVPNNKKLGLKTKTYTFFIASRESGRLRQIRIPYYILHVLAGLALVGAITVSAALGSYSRMLWKVTNYNAMRRDQANLKKQYSQLQTAVKETNQRLSSLQSLASEVAVTYGISRLPTSPFGGVDSSQEPDSAYQHSVAQFNFLEHNTPPLGLTSVSMTGGSLSLLAGPALLSSPFVPSLWPVAGELTGRFGERMDPFNGEGTFHSGVDIASRYGDEVHASADGVVVETSQRGGYGRVIIIDHGFGVTTWYGHLSGFNVQPGMQVKRGDVIGFEGKSGRASGPHVHYEVRLNNTPVNPWRYLHGSSASSGD